MDITQVRVFPVDEDKLKAFVSIVIDGCFVVSDIKIIEGANGLFISMPSKKRKNGTFRDIAHPLNNETRRWLEDRIVGEYREALGANGDAEATPVRSLDAAADRAGAGDVDVFGSDAAPVPGGGGEDPDLEPDDGRPSWP